MSFQNTGEALNAFICASNSNAFLLETKTRSQKCAFQIDFELENLIDETENLTVTAYITSVISNKFLSVYVTSTHCMN